MCQLQGKLSVLMRKGWYGSAKNLAEWVVGTDHDLYDGDLGIQTAIAQSAWQIGDYAFAAERFLLLKDLCDPRERRLMEARLREFDRMREGMEAFARTNPAPWVACNDPRLGKIITRLGYLFRGISRPVDVYVAEDEADYTAYMRTKFPACTTRFADFGACGFHADGADSCIVFRRGFIDGDPAAKRAPMSDEALLGLAAHEMAHLELYGTRVDEAFGRLAEQDEHQPLDMYVNERLTDLCVLSKGLARALFFAREADNRSSEFVMSREDIKRYMDGIWRVREGSAW
ncbi:MAG: hypothetical protein IKP40_11190 [Clostridia bacterium]|nr:hypothetical protein [Clostridia bacterium]